MIKQLTNRRNKEMGIDTKTDKTGDDLQKLLNYK